MMPLFQAVTTLIRHPTRGQAYDVFFAYHSTIGCEEHRVEQQLATIRDRKMPTVVVVSDNDRLLSKEDNRTLLRRLGCDPEKTSLYDKGGHLIRSGSCDDVVRAIELKDGTHYGFVRYPDICNKALLELITRGARTAGVFIATSSMLALEAMSSVRPLHALATPVVARVAGVPKFRQFTLGSCDDVVKAIELEDGSHYGFARYPDICNKALLELINRVQERLDCMRVPCVRLSAAPKASGGVIIGRHRFPAKSTRVENRRKMLHQGSLPSHLVRAALLASRQQLLLQRYTTHHAASLLQGSPTAWLRDFSYNIPFLDKNGVDVLSFNWPDFAFTMATGYFWHSSDEKTRLVIDLLKKLNINMIDMLVSHSTGSTPAVQLIAEEPSIDVKSLALLMPIAARYFRGSQNPVLFNPTFMWAMKSRRGVAIMMPLFQAVMTLIRHPTRGQAYDVFFAYHSSIGCEEHRVEQQLATIRDRKMPTVVVVSDNDRLLSKEDNRTLLQRLGCDPEKTSLYDKGGHLIRSGSCDDVVKAIELKDGTHYGFVRYPDICNKALLELITRGRDR
ncbi:hypothetical protein MTO96_048210 [Rhipicephalus appendiculatus]